MRRAVETSGGTGTGVWKRRGARYDLCVNARARKLLEEIRELPKEDQAFIVEQLEVSLVSKLTQRDIDRAWAEEIAKRARQAAAGKDRGPEARAAVAQARAELRRR